MIRLCKQEDIEPMLAIWLQASVVAHSFIDREYWESKVPDMRTVYLPNSENYIYEDNGTVLGFASLYENTLAAIFVAPQSQGKSIGKQLITKVKSVRDTVNLAVYKENTASRAFYERCGFNAIKEQPDENTGHTEVLMEWHS